VAGGRGAGAATGRGAVKELRATETYKKSVFTKMLVSV